MATQGVHLTAPLLIITADDEYLPLNSKHIVREKSKAKPRCHWSLALIFSLLFTLIFRLIFLGANYSSTTLSPVITDPIDTVSRINTSVPFYILDKIKLAAQFSALSSYCSSFHPPGPCLRDWNRCVLQLASEPFNSHLYNRKNYSSAIMYPALTINSTLIQKFSSYQSHWHVGGEGMVLYHPQTQTIHVSFKGSTATIDWINDFRAWSARFNPLDILNSTQSERLRVHQGIKDIYVHIRKHAFEAIEVAIRRYPDAPVSISGHSLGGALAMLFTTEIRMLQLFNNAPVPPTIESDHGMAEVPYIPRIPASLRIDLLTFGEPRLGNSEFTQFFSDITRPNHDGQAKSAVARALIESLPQSHLNKSHPIGVYRVVNRLDVVPHLPPAFLGFQHYEPYYHVIETDDHGEAKVALCSNGNDDSKVYNDNDNEAINMHVPPECRFTGLSTTGHLHYFWDFSMVKMACFAM